MAKASSAFTGEVLHINAVRPRVNGSGNLQLILHSLDDINNVQLASIPMQGLTNIEPSILANFTDQRCRLEIKTTEINEAFLISRIVIFVRPTASGYPQ